MQTKDFLLSFIERMGKTGEVELFLNTFHDLPRLKFAILNIRYDVLKNELDTIAENIAWINKLDIYPIVILGLSAPNTPQDLRTLKRRFTTLSEKLAHSIRKRKGHAKYATNLWSWDKKNTLKVDLHRLSTILKQSKTPIIHPMALKEGLPILLDTETIAQTLAKFIKPKKYIHLTSEGGIPDRQNQLIPFMNVSQNKNWTQQIRPDTKPHLLDLQKIIKATPDTALIITSPAHLLREIFTIKGHGTFIKHHQILYTRSFEDLNKKKIKSLLEDAFNKQLSADYFEQKIKAILVQKEYEGIAIIQEINHIPYLDKFAVAKICEGTGLGKSLWQSMIHRFPKLIWRATPQNPMNAFYLRECEGCIKDNVWHVYWRGASPQEVLQTLQEILEKPATLYTKP